MPAPSHPVFVITGIALSGNKGAAAMALALIQGIRRRLPEARFALFTYYPEADRAWLPAELAPVTRLVDASPLRALLRLPALCWAAAAKRLRLPRWSWRWGAGIRALDGARAYLDASGISFVDGREKFLPFNLLVTLPGPLLGVPTVKVSQALGPFRHWLNRLAARAVLPRLLLVCARGEATEGYLRGLGLSNVARYPDVTFSYQLEAEPAPAVVDALAADREVVGVSPSQVVHAASRRAGIDYLPLLRDFVVRLLQQGSSVVVLAHSARRGTAQRHNNDLPVLAQLERLLDECGALGDEHLVVIGDELSPTALRRLIGRLDILVASRLHAVVAALCMGTPALVMGWSHKYAEILASFGQERYALDYGTLSPDALWQGLETLRRERPAWLAAHGPALARARADSDRFFDDVLDRLDTRKAVREA
ncbi:MAG TPA: polysaccharide pyruvyl transferase family protein [Thermoanaerobaculia bacterium]|nr:polysaccharide pyruvyl transferase family protein [Thermoanaerobaculia bacterium]